VTWLVYSNRHPLIQFPPSGPKLPRSLPPPPNPLFMCNPDFYSIPPLHLPFCELQAPSNCALSPPSPFLCLFPRDFPHNVFLFLPFPFFLRSIPRMWVIPRHPQTCFLLPMFTVQFCLRADFTDSCFLGSFFFLFFLPLLRDLFFSPVYVLCKFLDQQTRKVFLFPHPTCLMTWSCQ